MLGTANVVIVADHDEAGLKCRDQLLRLLPSARVLLGEPHEDVRDLLARVGPKEFSALLASTTEEDR